MTRSVTVGAFLKHKIAYTDILDNIEQMLDDSHNTDINTLDDIRQRMKILILKDR